MADLKISALPASTTPLAGTEVLPVVQSGSTKQVSVANLTAGRAVSAASADLYLGASNGTYFRGGSGNTARQLTMTTTTVSNPGDTHIIDAISGSGNIIFATASVNQFLINSSGNVALYTGNLEIRTSGKGIDFSATSGSGTSELLADYEEGTFTPVVQGSSSAGTATYSAQNGRYTKIGNKVFFEVYVNYNSGTGTGNLRVGGLPFTSVAAGLYGSVSIGEFNNIALTALNVPAAEVSSGGTQIEFYQNVVGGGGTTAIPYDAAGYMIFGGFYTTAS